MCYTKYGCARSELIVTGKQKVVTGGQKDVTGGQKDVTGEQKDVTGGQKDVTEILSIFLSTSNNSLSTGASMDIRKSARTLECPEDDCHDVATFRELRSTVSSPSKPPAASVLHRAT